MYSVYKIRLKNVDVLIEYWEKQCIQFPDMKIYQDTVKELRKDRESIMEELIRHAAKGEKK